MRPYLPVIRRSGYVPFLRHELIHGTADSISDANESLIRFGEIPDTATDDITDALSSVYIKRVGDYFSIIFSRYTISGKLVPATFIPQFITLAYYYHGLAVAYGPDTPDERYANAEAAELFFTLNRSAD